LVEILPNIIAPLVPLKMGNNPQQAEWSFGDISSTLPYKTQINKPVTPCLTSIWKWFGRKPLKDSDSQKSNQKTTKKRAKRIWDIDQFRLKHYLGKPDELMIQAYRNELDVLKEIGDKLLHIETQLVKERSPIVQEEHQLKVKILPFENNHEFYQCANSWGMKRNDSSH